MGVVLYVVTLLVVRYTRDLERYRYLLLLLAGILLAAPLFFSPINGARLWVDFGGLEFQPIEFSKPPVHLLRLVLRREQGDAVHSHSPGGEPAGSRPPPSLSPCSWPGAPPWP